MELRLHNLNTVITQVITPIMRMVKHLKKIMLVQIVTLVLKNQKFSKI